MATTITLPSKPLTQVNRGGSQFLHGKTRDGADVFVWQNGYDNNLVQIVKNEHLLAQETLAMNEVVAWLTPLGVYDEAH